MKKSIMLSIAFVFVALFAVTGFGQDGPAPAKPKAEEPKKEVPSPLLSSWDVVIAAPGQDLAGTLKLEKDPDSHFKGSVTTDFGEAPMKNIKVTADSFTADITVNAQGQTMEGTISGKFKDGKLDGEVNLPALGALPYSGKKH